MSDRVSLLQVRLVCKEADRGSLHVKSTFDKTEKLEHRTDEAISFTDDDLVIVKNCRESPCRIELEAVHIAPAQRVICRPSRSSAFNLTSKVASEIRCKRAIVLGGGESLVMQSSSWKPSAKRGNYHGAV